MKKKVTVHRLRSRRAKRKQIGTVHRYCSSPSAKQPPTQIVTVQRRLQLASTPVTPRSTATDSPTEDRSLRHRQTPNRLQRRLHRTTAVSAAQIRITNHTRHHKPPDAATYNTHHSQHRFGFTAAKAAPQPVLSSSAPATAHSTIVVPRH